MSIYLALLFCIPIGYLMFLEARYLLKYWAGRYEERERKAARVFGVFGGLLIPVIYCSGLTEDAFPGKIGKVAVAGLWFTLAAVVAGIVGRIMTLPSKRN
jgi:hypothetical protein